MKSKLSFVAGCTTRPRSRALRSAACTMLAADFDSVVVKHTERVLENRGCRTLQINIGLTCNQACTHCHVASSPARGETMPRSVAERLVYLAGRSDHVGSVDITGGAPEMHEQFAYLVREMRALGLQVIDRCNLTVLSLPGMEQLPDFLAEHRVKVVASLPCYTRETVDKQRGDDVFQQSIAGLRKLNAKGYGARDSGLQLDLVYNPSGAFLPPEQSALEQKYKEELSELFGIEFNRLICIANMPIKRFRTDLKRSHQLEQYESLLRDSFNPATLERLMCVDQVHVSYDGSVHDCDFNYALGLANRKSVFDIDHLDDLTGRRIQTGSHCFGCTAGSGSSCGGALSA